jgi:hypothetical protein
VFSNGEIEQCSGTKNKKELTVSKVFIEPEKVESLKSAIEGKSFKLLWLSKKTSCHYSTLLSYLNGYSRMPKKIYDKAIEVVEGYK